MDSADAEPVGPDPRIIHPESYESYSKAAEGKSLRFRDLPRAEKIRVKVEEAVRYYAQVHGRVLTADAIGHRIHWKVRLVGEITVDEIVTALNDPVTIANLRALGILSPEVMSWDEVLVEGLTPTTAQMDALDSVLGRAGDDNRSLTAVLAEHGIPLKTWNGWMADPVFAGYVKTRTENLVGDRSSEVDIALMRKVASGDVPAIKLMLQLQGRLSDHRAADAGQILGRVVEIILEEVQDQAVVERVARRMQALADQVARPAAGLSRPTDTRDPVAERKTIIPGEVALP